MASELMGIKIECGISTTFHESKLYRDVGCSNHIGMLAAQIKLENEQIRWLNRDTENVFSPLKIWISHDQYFWS